jgi:hypothetical protein
MKEIPAYSKLGVIIWFIIVAFYFHNPPMSHSTGAVIHDSRVVVDAKVPRLSFDLVFTISNRSSSALILRRSNVPWMFPYTCTLAAVQTSHSSDQIAAMKMTRPLRDPPVGKFTIGANAAETGSIKLVRFFPEIVHVIKTNDVLVRWSYELRAIEFTNNFSGSILIPSEGQGLMNGPERERERVSP